MGSTAMPFVWFGFFCLAVFLTLRLLAGRAPVFARLSLGLHPLSVMVGANLFLASPLAALHADAINWVRVVLLFLSVYIGLRVLDFWIFEVMVPRRRDVPVPLVLRDIVRWVLTLVALLLIVRAIFPQVNLNVLAVSSIVVGYILGNASQDTLGNLISGLAMNTESPFTIGDWVEVGGHTGRVVDMSWRATCLRTKMDDHVIIPNSTISRDAIVNYSRPTGIHGCYLNVGVNYGVPPNKVRRVLFDVLKSVPDVLATPEPDVRLIAYSDFAIDYRMTFHIRDFGEINQIQSKVMYQVWYHFKREDIVIPFPIRDVNVRQVTADEEARQRQRDTDARLALLNAVDFFAPLSATEREQLAGALVERVFAAGEQLVRQGEDGQTFYIVMTGRVRVSVDADGHTTTLATLQAGDFFGEMSMLTGAKRSATVTAADDTTVLILSHTALGAILATHEKLAAALAAVLARRQQEQTDATHTADKKPSAVSETVLLSRIRRFFRLDCNARETPR